MPQVQVLPYVPSFGEKLASSFGQAAGNVGQAYYQKKAQQSALQQLNELQNSANNINTNASPVDKVGEAAASASNTGVFDIAKAAQIQKLGDKALGPGGGKLATELYVKNLETKDKRYESDREYNTKRAFKFLDEVDESQRSLPEREAALNTAFAAVESGQNKPFGGNFWAGVTGLPQLKNESGAQLEAAAKTHLMGSLGRLPGGRPNQFIEKQIDSAFAKAGETPSAQRAKLLVLKSVLDMDKFYNETAERIAEEQRSQFGYPKESISRDVNKAVKSYNENKLKELSYDLQENMESSLSESELSQLKKAPKGTPLTYERKEALLNRYNGDEEKARKIAIGLGYEIPEISMYQRK